MDKIKCKIRNKNIKKISKMCNKQNSLALFYFISFGIINLKFLECERKAKTFRGLRSKHFNMEKGLEKLSTFRIVFVWLQLRTTTTKIEWINNKKDRNIVTDRDDRITYYFFFFYWSDECKTINTCLVLKVQLLFAKKKKKY